MLSPSKPKILCSIDCLIDMRLRALVLTQPESYVESIMGERYINRISDDMNRILPGFDKAKFNKMIESGDKDLLRNTSLTSIVLFLSEDKKVVERDMILNPNIDNIIFHINVYPFEFSESAKELLKNSIAPFLAQGTEIDVVSIPLTDLTPKFVSENYTRMFIYYLHKWVTSHHQALLKNPIPSVTINSPTLEIGTYEFKKGSEEEKFFADANQFKMYESLTAEFFRLEFLDTAAFSIISKPA